MNVIRPVQPTDLPIIYDMQLVPFRDQVFTYPLKSYALFEKESIQKLTSGFEYYFLMEQDGLPAGFVQFLKSSDDWEALTWGKWLNTLVYATGVLAFDKLQFPKLTFSVRHNNKRVIHLYEKFQFRKVKQLSILYDQGLFNVLTHLNLYEVTDQEFRERSLVMKKNSLPLIFS